MIRHTRFLYGTAAAHSLGGLALAAGAIINGWPWPIYVIAALALIIAMAIAAVANPI